MDEKGSVKALMLYEGPVGDLGVWQNIVVTNIYDCWSFGKNMCLVEEVNSQVSSSRS